MVKMRIKGCIIGGMLCCMTVFSGCTAGDTIKLLIGHQGEVQSDLTDVNKNAYVIDEKVQKAEFTQNLGGESTYAVGVTAEAMSVACTVSDGGTLSYQWYRNNVDSNGGGSVIEGATEASYIPSTETEGTTFYYVVVTNNIDDHIRMVTSTTQKIVVTEVEDDTADGDAMEE